MTTHKVIRRPDPPRTLGTCCYCFHEMDTNNSDFSHLGRGIVIRCGRCKGIIMHSRNPFDVFLRYEKGVIGECPKCRRIVADQYEMFTKVCECGELVSMRYDYNEDKQYRCRKVTRPDGCIHHDALERSFPDPHIYVC